MRDSETAFAKVNLFLDVLRRREDMYHDIGTLFQMVRIGDSLYAETERSGAVSLSYETPQDYPVESDLVYRAALLLRNEAGTDLGVRMHLSKRLPLGAGLGGGSADCAAALRLLNRLWGLGLGMESLEQLGARLGADVPFLVRGGAALANGIGDLLEPVKVPWMESEYHILVATPHCAVPTRAAYAGICPSGPERWEAFRMQSAIQDGRWTGPDLQDSVFVCFNKFEETVLPAFPLVVALKERLAAAHPVQLLMSGSGASVFAVFLRRTDAEQAAEAVRSLCRFLAITVFAPAYA